MKVRSILAVAAAFAVGPVAHRRKRQQWVADHINTT